MFFFLIEKSSQMAWFIVQLEFILIGFKVLVDKLGVIQLTLIKNNSFHCFRHPLAKL